MIDYAKYEVIKTKKIIHSNSNTGYETAYKNQEADVNYAIKNLLADGFEIIEITHDNIGMMASTFRYIYTITNITYGKLKSLKSKEPKMKFETKGKLLQLKDDYIKNVTVTNTTTVTKGPSDFESKEYTLNVDIELKMTG